MFITIFSCSIIHLIKLGLFILTFQIKLPSEICTHIGTRTFNISFLFDCFDLDSCTTPRRSGRRRESCWPSIGRCISLTLTSQVNIRSNFCKTLLMQNLVLTQNCLRCRNQFHQFFCNVPKHCVYRNH